MTSACPAASAKACSRATGIVPHHAHVQDLHAELGQEPEEGIAIAVVDLPRGQWPADGGQLVAGGEEGDARPTVNGHLGEPQGGQQPELRRSDPPAGEQGGSAGGQVLPGSAHVLAGFADGGQDDPLALDPGRLLHDHGIRTPGNHGPGHYPHRLARPHQAGEGPAGIGGAHQIEAVLLRRQVRGTGGKAVHGGVVVGGDIEGGDDILLQHPPQGGADRDQLPTGHRGHRIEQGLASLGDA